MEVTRAQSPYARNLLRNYAALDGLNHWSTPEGENRPEVEEVKNEPWGVESIKSRVALDGPVKHWVTSNKFASMSQEVDLLKEGFPADWLDTQRPPVYAAVWYAGRSDCASEFRFTVELINGCKQVIDKTEVEKKMTEKEDLGTWQMIHHTFQGYNTGLRYIRVTMGGKDLKNWAGNYGAKFTLPTVRFVFNN